ncbi:MAG TPA: isoaspartyl peptidase/L-asparaginase [Bacteroidota bacterium]|nr:isoaspartyl peptidase/L-asparaginase [Bacteroidota bacterium]
MHSTAQQTPSSQPVRIVIHGGAGTILKQNMTSEMEKEYTDKLTEALLAGYKLLEDGRPALDAVEAAIKIMEDSPLFNAGKGAVFTHEGTNELDASIMDGKTLKAGSVAGVKHIRNPISLARIVMEKSPHVMMAGEGAEAFAKQQGIEMVPPEYFRTERRWNQLQQLLEKEKRQQDSLEQHKLNALPFDTKEEQLGTVGCVARDKMGNLAAGTSTGGMTNKRFGRIGDSPIIGAGTYANNSTCAVSATGDGEFFIRSVVAHDIAALLDYRSLPLQKAAETVIDKVGKLGGTGGVICLDSKGNIALVFNSEGMYRAYMDETDKPVVLIYR